MKMKKILFPAVLALVTALTFSISVFAELVPTDKQWNVSFTTDKKMTSDFKNNSISDSVSGLQPGDYTDIVLNLKNDNTATVDWYMTNKVIKSLEDTRANETALSGGAYTYTLTFTNSKTGEERVLFDSDTVGGESVSAAGQGLHEATSALGEDWLYLDTFKNGEGGTINLRVELEGETQGNDYQDTLAQLQMNFAVELNETTTNNTSNKTSNNTSNNTSNRSSNGSSSSTTRSSTNNVVNEVVRTGDETNMVPYFIASGVSGLFLLVLAIYSLRERRRQRGGKA